ncbi:tumor suppressor, Mitostatin-domain-containing protein [Entophlyctis helioformis]|nr:tumor suppressor, Mitostatin-domain-containing protein [Entophlyctis helioformis]
MISSPAVHAAAVARRAMQEKREQESRRRENMREDIVKHLQHDTLLMSTYTSDNRVEQTRRLRTQKLNDQERQTYESLIEDERKRREIEESIKHEEQIVAEMERIHHEQVMEQKLRQSIRENSSELRELEKKLNYAYMNKERSLQLQEKSLLQKHAKVKEAEFFAAMKAQAEKAKDEELEKQKSQYERSIEYHKALNHQLAEAEAKKQQDYEQFLKEKAIVDQIVQRIQEENEREAKQRLEKQRETKQYIEDFMKERERWRQLEVERQLAENTRIEEYAHIQHQREADLEQKKKRIEADKGAIYDRLAAEMQAKERAMARRKDKELLEQRIRKRLELIDAYQQQVKDKKLRLEKERSEEEEFRQKMMRKFAEDDKLEQLNQQKRRMRQIEHKRAVDALVEERRRLFQEQIDDQQRQLQREMEIEKYRQAVIEQERQRLLREHASKLVGYLPKGVLRDEKDLELFDQDFRRRFERLYL